MTEHSAYPGLRPFEETDSPIFFGREPEIEKLLSVLDEQAFVILSGVSGSGKTSLLRAGLLPTLARNPKNKYLTQFFIRPGSNPLSALSEALSNGNQVYATQLLESLTNDPNAIISACEEHSPKPGNLPVLVIDQFEELYTLSDPNEAAHFLNVILLANKSHRLAIAISVREEYLANLAKDNRILQRLCNTLVFLGDPTTDDLRQAIVRPAEQRGISFEADAVEEIVRAVQEAGDRQGGFLILQVLLSTLINRTKDNIISLKDINENENIEKSIEDYLKTTVNRYSSPDQARLRHILGQLVSQQGLRRIAEYELFETPDKKIIDQLASERIVRLQIRNGISWVELFHDRLAVPVNRILEELNSQEERRSKLLSNLVGSLGFYSLEVQIEKRAEERYKLQIENDDLNNRILKLKEQKSQLERRYEASIVDYETITPKIFISYIREDERAALKLYNDLKEKGIKPWIDKEDLLAGVEWDREIRKVIRESDFILICISSRTPVKRGYIQKELRLALDLYEEIPPGEVFLLPVRLEECEIPEDFSKYQYIDLFDTAGFDRLITSIFSSWDKRNRRSS